MSTSNENHTGQGEALLPAVDVFEDEGGSRSSRICRVSRASNSACMLKAIPSPSRVR